MGKFVESAIRIAAAGVLHDGLGPAEAEDRRLVVAPLDARGELVLLEVAGHIAGEDPEVVERDVAEHLLGDAEVLGEDVERGVGEPVGEQEGVGFGLRAVVEDDDELCAIRSETLQRVRESRREEPQVALVDVFDARHAGAAERGDAAAAACHERPLGGLVPVQLADPACLEVHVDPGDLVGDREVGLRDLTGPAAWLHSPRRDAGRVPFGRSPHGSDATRAQSMKKIHVRLGARVGPRRTHPAAPRRAVRSPRPAGSTPGSSAARS